MSPYRLLGLDQNSSMDELKNKFKQLINVVHPDKGGNKDLFDVFWKAYKQIEVHIETRDNVKSQHELKETFATDCESLLRSQHKMKFEIGKFNKIFEEHNTNNLDKGHSDFLKSKEIVKHKAGSKDLIEYQIPTSFNEGRYATNYIVDDDENYTNSYGCDIKEAYTEREKLDTNE